MKYQNIIFILSLLILTSLSACMDLDVPDFNNPSLDDFEKNPTPSAVKSLATGLLVGHRRDVAVPNGYVVMLGVLGREAYNFDVASDPRMITEMLMGPLDAGSPRFGGNFWVQPYANIRNANILLIGVDNVSGMTNSEKQAIRGFAKTIQALDFLVVVNTRDQNGGPIEVGGSFDDLGPIATKAQLLSHISILLDEAKTHLLSGGSEFPFSLSSGFAGFNTPSTFIQFNRAIKARVSIYQEKFQEALNNLNESFIHTDVNDPQLGLGVYHAFGSGSGDTLNELNNPNIYAHPSIITDAEPNDERLLKLKSVTEASVEQGFKSNVKFDLYKEITSPVPIIRNEELILLRAEANYRLDNFEEAAEDINYIRVVSGNLPELLYPSELDESNILDELLHQKRYSLLFEGGHRWIDMRRYERLNETYIDKVVSNEVFNQSYPIPVEETDPRD